MHDIVESTLLGLQICQMLTKFQEYEQDSTTNLVILKVINHQNPKNIRILIYFISSLFQLSLLIALLPFPETFLSSLIWI